MKITIAKEFSKFETSTQTISIRLPEDLLEEIKSLGKG
jgi:predicted DNA binding CopG/RHH family protein